MGFNAKFLSGPRLAAAAAGVIMLLVSGLTLTSASAQTATPETPTGFQLLRSAEGVWLFKKDYPNGTPDYVQVIDLSSGAAVQLHYAQIVQPRPGKGFFGGDDPRFSLQPLDAFWQRVSTNDDNAFCVSNGSFFYMLETPTRLAFPLKVDGKVITDGFGNHTYPGQKLMLELWPDRADIRELTRENLYGSEAPDIIAGLEEDANKRARHPVGRTFIGLADANRDGSLETVLILNTSTAVQAEVAGVLREFGSEKIMMLDGGGSTQLICQGQSIIESERLIPQAIAVLAGIPAPVAAGTDETPVWLTGVVGENLSLEIELTNTGEETWEPGNHKLVLESSPINEETEFAFESNIAQGEAASFVLELSTLSEAGLHKIPLTWYIERGGERFPGQPIDLRVVLQGTSREEQNRPLSEDIEPGSTMADKETQARSEGELAGEEASPDSIEGPRALQIRMMDLLWVPVLMLPLALFLLTFIRPQK